MLFSHSEVQNAIRRPMSDENINIVGNGTPKFLTLIFAVHKTPIEELWRVRWPEYSDAFNLNHFMLQIGANFFQLLYFFFSVEWAILMLKIFKFLFVSLLVECKIMVTCNNNLMLIRYHLQKLPEPLKLLFSWIFGEISCVDEDVCFREFLNVDFVMKIMCIRHCDYCYVIFIVSFCLHIYKILAYLQTKLPWINQKGL